MRIIKNIIVAFSLYSQIPMPRFEWKEDDMKHNIVFLAWIGVVIGLISWGFYGITRYIELPLICKVAIYSLIPLVVTGGFHVDGYMDVQDALKSYKSTAEKLEILKDPHIGAFAIIRMMIYNLVWIGAMAVIVDRNNKSCIYAYFLIFFLARTISAMTSLKCKHAKKDGMLNMETAKSTKIDFVMCALQAVIAILVYAYIDYRIAIVITIVCVVHWGYYRNLCYKQFGGVTGDTSGYCITSLEEWLLVAIAVLSIVLSLSI